MELVNRCKCYKSKKQQNEQCPRSALPGSDFCGLHKTCKITNIDNPDKPGNNIIDINNYDIDWKKNIYKDVKNGYSIIVIPVDTVFYVSSLPQKICKRRYFATLKTALFYALLSEKKNVENVIYTFQTTIPIYLLDVTNSKNFELIKNKFKIDTEDYTEIERPKNIIPKMAGMDVFKYAFDDGKNRYSQPEVDDTTMYWVCDNLNLDGWCITEMSAGKGGVAKWHDEIAVCEPSNKMKQLDYSFVQKDNKIILVRSKYDTLRAFNFNREKRILD